MIFKQLFDTVSSTYTYLLACEATGQAILIDPVLPEWERDLAEINKRGLKLAYTVETFTMCQDGGNLAQFLRASFADFNDAAALLKVIHAQWAAEACGSGCGQHMVGSRAVVA